MGSIGKFLNNYSSEKNLFKNFNDIHTLVFVKGVLIFYNIPIKSIYFLIIVFMPLLKGGTIDVIYTSVSDLF